MPDGEVGPSVRILNASFELAVERQAQEIRIETGSAGMIVKCRFADGSEEIVERSHRLLQPVILSRIKGMAQLDIVHPCIPQEGRFRLRCLGKLLDVSVSIMPTEHGEDAVLRITDVGSTEF